MAIKYGPELDWKQIRPREKFDPDPRLEDHKTVVLPFLQACKMLGKKYDNASMTPQVERIFDDLQLLQELKRQDELDAATDEPRLIHEPEVVPLGARPNENHSGERGAQRQ